METASPEARVMTPLAQLLLRRMHENGWRLRDVSRPPDGVRPGAPARATMSQHLQAGYWLSTMPRPKTIEELAVAVRVKPEEIREAAWRSLEANRGMDPAGDEEKTAPVGRPSHGGPVLPLEGLTDEQQAQLRQLAELFRAQNPKAGP